MANCSSCSAPLPANTQYCRYCGVRNDVDLQGKHDFQLVAIDSERMCPKCQQPLQTVVLNEGALHIERCQTCFGLFFDPGEIEALLDSAVSPVFSVNLELLANVNADRYAKDKTVKYLACPVCQVLMNRVLYGYRSGVVIDQCKSHGVWLGGGEISHLLEWKKAGGLILDQKAELRQKQAKSRPSGFVRDVGTSRSDADAPSGDAELLVSVAELIFKVFQ